MMGRLIKLKDLKVGDEIIISSYSNLKYLKVVQPVKTSKKTWNDIAYYPRVKCSIRQDLVQSLYRPEIKRFKYVFEKNIKKHNRHIYIDLNDRDIYLVKRYRL